MRTGLSDSAHVQMKPPVPDSLYSHSGFAHWNQLQHFVRTQFWWDFLHDWPYELMKSQNRVPILEIADRSCTHGVAKQHPLQVFLILPKTDMMPSNSLLFHQNYFLSRLSGESLLLLRGNNRRWMKTIKGNFVVCSQLMMVSVSYHRPLARTF
jgi:hypothetical protein